MGKLYYEFFRGEAVVKDIKDHGTHRKPGAMNDATPSVNLRITGNVGMHNLGHGTLSPFFLKSLP
jgi:hypothetical protein